MIEIPYFIKLDVEFPTVAHIFKCAMWSHTKIERERVVVSAPALHIFNMNKIALKY